MTDIEHLVKQCHKLIPEISETEILEKIESIRKTHQLDPRLDEQTIIRLVLTYYIQSEKKSEEEKDDLNQDEKSSSSENIWDLIEEDYHSLRTNYNKLEKFKKIIIILVAATVSTFLGNQVITQFLNLGIDNVYFIPQVLLIASIIIGILAIKSIIRRTNKLFFHFSAIFYELDNFITNTTAQNRKYARNMVETADNYVDDWSYRFTPSAYYEPTIKLSKNLNKLRTLIKNIQVDVVTAKEKHENDKKINELKSFNKELKSFVLIIHDRQPTTEELSNINKIFNVIKSVDEGPPTREKVRVIFERIRNFLERIRLFFEKHPIALFIFPPIVGYVVYSFQYSLGGPEKQFDAAGYGVGAAIAVLVGIFTYISVKPKK